MTFSCVIFEWLVQDVHRTSNHRVMRKVVLANAYIDSFHILYPPEKCPIPFPIVTVSKDMHYIPNVGSIATKVFNSFPQGRCFVHMFSLRLMNAQKPCLSRGLTSLCEGYVLDTACTSSQPLLCLTQLSCPGE